MTKLTMFDTHNQRRFQNLVLDNVVKPLAIFTKTSSQMFGMVPNTPLLNKKTEDHLCIVIPVIC